tara:strand:- start:4857 stop:5867 length:1011 start_codon:yes stop_codon:yes gene_type:complete
MFDDASILVTGGTGSFGRAFIARLLKDYRPKKIIVYSRDEWKQYEMQTSTTFESDKDLMRYFIGDIRDKDRLMMAMSDVDYIVHAAALKQVPALEYNPFEAVKTNIVGTQNVIDASIACKAKKVVAISTDKAAAPINLYGATKLTADKLVIAANNIVGEHDTRFSVVRYGNVLGSRGSVVPYFLSIKAGGDIPITDPRMTRFSITLTEGVDFVIRCFEMMHGGELFVPKIPSYRITDLATAIAPDARQVTAGIRPGEKLHEEMITPTDAMTTLAHANHYVVFPSISSSDYTVDNFLDQRENHKSYSKCPEEFRYASDTNPEFLSVDKLCELVGDLS